MIPEELTCYGCGTILEGTASDEVYGLWCQDCGGSSKPTINYRAAIHDAVEANVTHHAEPIRVGEPWPVGAPKGQVPCRVCKRPIQALRAESDGLAIWTHGPLMTSDRGYIA